MSQRVTLIVDDEPAIRSYVRTILEREHFKSLEAATAIEGLKVVHKLRGCLDLVVTDINMPGDLDGLDLARSIRQSFPQIEVILMTGYDTETIRASGFELIRKPFGPEDLLNLLRD